MDLFSTTTALVRRRGRVDWAGVATRYMPFADVATAELPLLQLVRLALFQVSVGMVTVLTVGTLNRVMIIELGVGAWLVSLMVALPLLFAPFRALVGFKSDQHRSALGWRRVPYIWFGSGALFAGLAIMPFSLVLLTGETTVQLAAGHIAAGLAFLLAGAGAQTVQTAGLALATDRATPATRPRVVALMYVMLLLGMVGSGALFAWLLADYTPTRLVQVVQGTAVACLMLNLVAVWKQEARDRSRAPRRPTTPRSPSAGRSSRSTAASCASCSPWAWARRPSACRTSSSSPTAARSWASASARPPGSPASWRSAPCSPLAGRRDSCCAASARAGWPRMGC
jgi:BCD family chlorophyll transporter-like MFS transporter